MANNPSLGILLEAKKAEAADTPKAAKASAAGAAKAASQSLGDDEPLHPDPFDPLPDRYVIRDIGYEIDDSGSLQFLFRNPGLALPLPTNGIDEVIALLMNQPLAPSIENFLRITAAVQQQTPLDIQLKNKSAYIIFRLPKNGNLYFAPKDDALTHKKVGDVGYCAELRHVGVSGPSVDPVDGCKLIYFMARPRMKGQPPTTDDYYHSLNIKARLLQRPHFGSALPRVLDIVLDPDVRYPGGSVTEEP